jgi:hypothetical protein
MPSKAEEPEHQPFLSSYSDDPTTSSSEPSGQFRNNKTPRTIFISHSLVFIITSLLWMLVLSVILSPSSHYWKSSYSKPGDPRHNVTSNAQLLTCGNTTQQALAQGCKYDILLNNWVPAPCFDADSEDFIADYTDDKSWGAFADKNMTQRFNSVQEMSESEIYYTSVRDHINHCAVLWKKQFWALFEEKKAFDTVVASPGHTDHCAQYLIDVVGADWTEATKVERGFAGCWVRG